MEALQARLSRDAAPAPAAGAGAAAEDLGRPAWPAACPPPAPVPTRGERARRQWAGLVLLLFAAPGCLALEKCCPGCDKNCPPKPTDVCQVVATWSKEVYYVPDPTRGGTPGPGLAGRVYLFGPNIDCPRVGDGGMVVELYDDAAAPGGKLLEQWQFDKETLKKLLKKDIIGWGYTLFLPWGTIRPDITRVHLTCRYDSPQGPLYAPTSPITLQHPPSPVGSGVATAAAATPAPAATAPAAPALPVPAPPVPAPQPLPMPTPVR
jgi:hypothetical protein